MSVFNNSHEHKYVDRHNMGWAIRDGLQIMTFTWIYLLIKILFHSLHKKIQLFASGNFLINKNKSNLIIVKNTNCISSQRRSHELHPRNCVNQV